MDLRLRQVSIGGAFTGLHHTVSIKAVSKACSIACRKSIRLIPLLELSILIGIVINLISFGTTRTDITFVFAR